MAVIIIAVGRWLEKLNPIQVNALWIAGISIGMVLLTYYLDWQRKRSIDAIPELLAQLHKLTMDYIDNHAEIETPEALLDDLADVMHIDIGNLKAAANSGNKKRAEQEFAKFTDRHSSYSKKFSDNIMSLRLMSGLMNEYNVGLKSITDFPDYQRIYKRVMILRRRLPSALISTKINDYFHQTEALYSMLISIEPFEHLGELRNMIPAKTRAYREITLPLVEGHINTLISAIRESITEYKDGSRKQQKEKANK